MIRIYISSPVRKNVSILNAKIKTYIKCPTSKLCTSHISKPPFQYQWYHILATKIITEGHVSFKACHDW